MFKNAMQRLVAAILIMGMLVPSGGSARELAGEVEALPTSSGLYRTQVTVRTPADWARLEKLGVVVLRTADQQKDADNESAQSASFWQSAVILADADQLETLARLRFEPQGTDELGMLVTAHAQAKPWLAASLRPLLAERAADQQKSADRRLDPSVSFRKSAVILTPELKAGLTTLSSVDDDADGLTNTQEEWWCTDPLNPDSDGDGTNDGDEVQAAKDWLGNLRGSYPSTGKPFVGWPPDHTGCYDDDQDSIPDLAERWELGLNMNRESTDRDKFDDGQELFGNTYCPGSGGYCGYGALPRNEDWGVIFAEMPSWVEAPGDHPLVAAFPVPEIDVVESSLHVETVTMVTTDHTIGEGAERSYSTAKMEGTSTSVANTETWNEWQEVSESLQQRVPTTRALTTFLGNSQSTISGFWGRLGKFALGTAKVVGGVVAPVTTCTAAAIGTVYSVGALSIPGGAVCAGTAVGGVAAVVDGFQDIGDAFAPDQAQQITHMNQYQSVDVRLQNEVQLDNQVEVTLNQNFDTKGIVRALDGTRYAYLQTGELISTRLYEIANILAAPVRTTTNTQGRSWGGSRTTTTEQYEEHTITNGEAFSSEESWGTATAVDSSNAAELWFTYKVRNTGTEYAREVGDLAFNIYIGDDPNPAITYFVGPDLGGDGKFHNFMPGDEHTYTSRRISLTLNQMAAIDLGGPVRIVVEDFTYGIDELFYEDAVNSGVLVAIEDGTDDGDEAIDTYLIPTWGEETVLDILARYFPDTTDADGNLLAVWTPEYRPDTPGWCNEPNRVGTTLWCKHALSTADWWNIYTDGMGDGSEGFQDAPATPGSVALFRFNKDSDLDGYSDRSEIRLGTDPNDPADHPKPELIAGVHSIRSGDQVVATLSLLNTGLYDAYGVEAVMIAPADSVSITNNTVGGSGRVRALKQVIVGSRILLQSPLPDPWTQDDHAVPAVGGYYTGAEDHTYTFTASCGDPLGCDVGSDTWSLAWDDGAGANGTLNFGDGYASPTFLDVGTLGVKLALYSGEVYDGDSFTVEARTPRDTFQYTINREPYTEPVIIVSYNDPQGNHRFVTPVHLSTPTENLAPHSGKMLHGDADVEIVTQSPFDPEQANTTTLIAQAPVATRLVDAHLFLEFIDPEGTVVREEATTVTLETGPNVVPMTWNPADFNPAYDPEQDYIVMAFFTDWQGNILDTAARPLSSFQEDPKPVFALDETATTWDFGTVPQGTLLEHTFTLANTGMMNLKATVVGTGVRTDQNVPGNPAWTDTGLDVANGDAIGIRASGTVCYCGTTCCSGPDGSGEAAPGGWALPGASKGSLIAKVGDGTPFFVGSTYVNTVSSSGRLYLGTNDCGGCYGDNGGAYQAHIEIQGVPTSLQESPSFSVSPADATNLDVTLDTHYLPAGSFNRSILVRTSDPAYPTQTFQVQGTIDPYVGPARSMAVSPYRPWDQRVAVSGDRQYREVVTFDDTIAADATTVHPLRVYNDTRQTALGVGKEIAQAAASGGLATSMADEAGLTIGEQVYSHDHGTLSDSGEYPPFSQNKVIMTLDFGDGRDGALVVSTVASESTDGQAHGQSNPFVIPQGAQYTTVWIKSGAYAGMSVGSGNACDGSAGAYLYEHPNYQGRCTRFTWDEPDTDVFEIGNDTASSIAVHGAWRATLYEHDNYQGTSSVFTSSDSDLGNDAIGHDRASSIRIEPLGGRTITFRAQGEVRIDGTLSVNGMGYKGGRVVWGADHGYQGESYTGSGGHSTDPNGGGGAGGHVDGGGGGGGYGSSGQPGHDVWGDFSAEGGGTYGNSILSTLYYGSGGGSPGAQSANRSAAGGPGGGIVSIVAPVITVNGLISANGLNGGSVPNNPGNWRGGGGGSGGSILLKGSTINVGSNRIRALGGAGGYGTHNNGANLNGGNGGVGRIRIEYCDTFSGSTNPAASTQKLSCYGTVSGKVFSDNNGNGSQDAGEPGLAGVTVSLSGGQTQMSERDSGYALQDTNNQSGVFGDGSDGDLTVSSGQTKYVDNVRTRMTSTAGAGQKNVSVASTSGFPVGDEVLVIQMQGTGAGNYEFGTIASIGSGRLTLQGNLQHTYTVGGNSKAQVLRVPHYRNVTVQGGGTLTAHAWDGNTGGIVAFRVSGKATVSGTISVNGGNGSKIGPGQGTAAGGTGGGFRGGLARHTSSWPAQAQQGEGTSGDRGDSWSANGNGGGGGYIVGSSNGRGGGGGGNGTAGTDGCCDWYANRAGRGGPAGGSSDLSRMVFGGGGGGGVNDGNSAPSEGAGSGGSGGGIVVILSKEIEVSGAIAANGGNGGTGIPDGGTGGSGAGGSILIRTANATLGTSLITATGGAGDSSWGGGNGGDGRIRIEYCDTFSGSTNPSASVAKINFCYGTVSGKVFRDDNGNGSQDGEEPGLSGETVSLSCNGQTVTGSDGSYSLTANAPANCNVSVTPPTGHDCITPCSVDIALEVDSTTTVNFALRPRASISGKVFHDTNNSGVQDAGESGVEGVTVTLDGTGQTRTTASDGSYSFDDLTPDSYSVSVSVPDGYVNTTPTTVSCNLGAGDTCTANFGILMYDIEKDSGSQHQIRLFMPEDFHGGRRYWVQYGREMTFGGAGEATAQVKLPQVHYGEATMDVWLAEAGNSFVQINLDVGNDGTWDWGYNGSPAIPTTLETSDFADDLNDFMDGATPGPDDLVTVPLRVSLNTSGQLYLTNLVAAPDGISDVSIAPEDIQLNPTDPVEGDTVNVQATLHNASGYDTGGLTVSFFATPPDGFGETYIGAAFVSNIPAGGTADASIQWNTLGFTGDVPVRVVADPYNRVAETNDDNNEATASLTILTRPDLHVTAIELSDPEPVAGQPVTVTLTISNAGQTDAGTSALALYDGNPDDDGTLLGEGTSAVGGESQTTLEFTWTPTAPGLYRLFAVSDRDDAVNEFDEGNNQSWEDIYIGFAGPVLLDSGAAGDVQYTTEQGYGYVDEGQADILSDCGTEPYQTYRLDADGRVVYHFDHLLSGHFYHLDVTLYECGQGAGRQEVVKVDDITVGGPEDLGDGEEHRLSILLDPALYADRTISVTVEAYEGLGALVNEIALHDVDYRYADSGPVNDPQYPTGDLPYGWLDGSSTSASGSLPYQTARVDLLDNDVQYQFDELDPLKRYQVHLSFYQSSGNNRVQQIWIDGQPTGTELTIVSGQHYSATASAPLTAYQGDGSIVVSAVRTNASVGAMINEIALEEETQIDAATCPDLATPFWTIAYNNVTIAGQPAPPGTVVTAESPRGDVVGCFIVKQDTPGLYGFMPIYGEDPTAIPPIPGMRDGELVTFRVNGALAVPDPPLEWHDDKTPHPVDLEAGITRAQSILLDPNWNLISFRVEPPTPLVNQVLNSIEGRYDRVLGETGVYVPDLPDVYNTLKELHCGEGYYLRLTGVTSVNLLVEGLPCAADTPIPLHQGWNWIGYLPEETLPTTQALQSIEGHYQRVLSLDKVYDPALPEFSTLQEMSSGEGYLIYASNPVTLTYPAGGGGGLGVQPSTRETACADVAPTPYLTLIYGYITINGQPASIGTRIDVVTPRGEIAGCFVVEQVGQYGLMHVYGADGTAEPPIPGFQESELLDFRVNGITANASIVLSWQDDKAPHEVNLDATVHSVYLPLMLKSR